MSASATNPTRSRPDRDAYLLHPVHFSSKRLDWRTPEITYQILYAEFEFEFDFDPCPSNPTFDGLSVPWGKTNFVNPPYGREIGQWIKKGHDEWLIGKTVVFLIPSRTDTRWWHDYVMDADEIRFCEGRLKFDGAKNGAPFPSAIVVFLANSPNIERVKAERAAEWR